jgi:hypothetical protein
VRKMVTIFGYFVVIFFLAIEEISIQKQWSRKDGGGP